MANKKKKCKLCREYVPTEKGVQLPGGFFCSINAAAKFASEKQAIKKERKAKSELAVARKVANWNDRKWLTKKAQEYFNRYIRLRDEGQPCISCGRPFTAMKKKNAGHYRTTKAAPHLRFNEDNCHLQDEYCNAYLSGNITAYREGLIERIGLERVEALENNNETKKYTAEELQQIIANYKQKCKEVE